MSDIYLSLTETPTVVTLSQPVVSGALAATVTVGNTVTVALDANSLSALEQVTVTVGAAVSISNFPSTQTVAGTVTANVLGYNASANQTGPLNLAFGQEGFGDGSRIGVALLDNSGNEFGTDFPLSVAGSVTANLSSANLNSVTIGVRGTVTANAILSQDVIEHFDESAATKAIAVHIKDENNAILGGISNPLPISGTVTANVFSIFGETDQSQFAINFGDNFAQGVLNFGSLAVSQQGPISGTVTVSSLPASTVTVSALPSGALTTRFGSVVTANLAQITSAVTNTSRKYLLAQNISAGTVTIGIGFSPTTTQGIQLPAGGGLTFDAFCPTGAVYWLGAVTGAAYTILEG